MASNRLLASLFLFSLGCFHLSALPSAAAAEKVRLELFYESLCPYCSRFIVGFLSSIFKDGLISIIDLNLVPYGNARVDSNGTITCQHGPYECLLNTVEACAISAWPDVNEHFNFIFCVEQLVLEHRYGEWESCFKKTGLEAKPVLDCYTNGTGQELVLKYAAETDALQPPHKYVPWVVVNGRPLYDDYETFAADVCKAYKGDLSEACKGLLSANAPQLKAKKPDRVCYSKDLKFWQTAWPRGRHLLLAFHHNGQGSVSPLSPSPHCRHHRNHAYAPPIPHRNYTSSPPPPQQEP